MTHHIELICKDCGESLWIATGCVGPEEGALDKMLHRGHTLEFVESQQTPGDIAAKDDHQDDPGLSAWATEMIAKERAIKANIQAMDPAWRRRGY